STSVDNSDALGRLRRSVLAFAMRPVHPVGFMNVDLEIVSRFKLDALETSVSDLGHALYSGPAGKKGTYLLALECNRYPKNADAGILALCVAVDRLSKMERRLWDRALSRRFDVGYELIAGVSRVTVALKPDTLRRGADFGAEG